ncbi:hypothetical protein PS880_03017 [Pseudomonas fluorescens]|uniref:Uncharacterized protein n=1 Tax=Pseudomonas fluorescens TaxID=294 RepID=A0A5E7KY75_PSEFL|nr:hypothetical protein PS880_03017 [Pseudomonas fluorescens]
MCYLVLLELPGVALGKHYGFVRTLMPYNIVGLVLFKEGLTIQVAVPD